MVKIIDSGKNIWNMYQGQIKKVGGGGLYTDTKGAWVTQQRGTSGCEIQNSIIKLIGNTQTQTDVVLVDKWGWN